MKDFLQKHWLPMAILALLAIFTTQTTRADEQDLKRCFNDYKGWRSPEKVKLRIKELVCDFYMAHPQYKYHHHSGWRGPSLTEWMQEEGEEKLAASQHTFGRALDHRGVDYRGMDRCQKLMAYKNFVNDVEFWRLGTDTDDMGFGIYPSSTRPFIHEDSLGLDPGEPQMRRWARVHGKYIGIREGYRWLETEIRLVCMPPRV